MMRLLPLLRAVLAGLQLPQPATVIGNADPVVQQLLAILAVAADELSARYPYTRRLIGGAWVRPAAGEDARAPTLDSDTILFDPPTIRAALTWRFQEANGLDYAEAFRVQEESLSRAAAAHLRANRDKVTL